MLVGKKDDKITFMVNAILKNGVSVLRVDESMRGTGKKIVWCAHTTPQDGYGGHNGKWAEAKTPQDAVWKLRKHITMRERVAGAKQ